MKITIVMGFFLPMPPVAGGATEKSWHGLAKEFAARGHEVVLISRRWPGFPNEQQEDGIRHLRLPGFAHTGRLLLNLWLDFLWSRRVSRALPPGDIVIVNCIALPVWLRRRRPDAGRVVVMPGRMPKGQYRLYRQIDRVLAVSSPVESALLTENPALRPATKISGYPIDWATLAVPPRSAGENAPLTIGFIGRIHREKGLDLLVSALELLAQRSDLPAWRFVLCGPVDVARGGSGEEYRDALASRLTTSLKPEQFSILDPIFDRSALIALYSQIDVFCYPSLAAQGETFGVAVAEAMAAGAVPVVSKLPCFTDFVRSGKNGETFDHLASDAAHQLAGVIARVLTDHQHRSQLAGRAREDVRFYDFPHFAERLLADFSTLK